jgi:signal transduction histidine kinase
LNTQCYAPGGSGRRLGPGGLFAARSAARAALAPLQETATVIGGIDEKSLDRRIAVEKLPAELAPVGTRLNDMLGRLETAFMQRKQFLADASHELRTPVAGLVTTLEVALRRRREADEYVRTLETCLSDARLLHQLVIALLDQVRSQRFGAEPELSPVPVTQLLRQCATLAGTLGAAKGVKVELEAPEGLLLLTDELKLRSMVTNLLSNAVEYTPGESTEEGGSRGGEGGRVRLTAELVAGSDGGWPPLDAALAELGTAVKAGHRRLVVRVIDNGPGIAAEHQPNLFEPFYRADAARTNPEHHLGLGLAIVRSHARALGGEVRVVSPVFPGGTGGCEFIVEIPTLALGERPEIGATEAWQRTSKPLRPEQV